MLMAYYYTEVSRTLDEYLLVPGHSGKQHVPKNVSLETPMVKYKCGERSELYLNIPMTSAIMQAVSDDRMAVALAKEGGVSFIYCSQPIENQVAMVKRVKSHKAGFVTSDANLMPDATLNDIFALKAKTGHSTIAVTEDGTANGRLLGIVTSIDYDYPMGRISGSKPVSTLMTPIDKLITAKHGATLQEAYDIIYTSKINCLPIIRDSGRLIHIVFRKDGGSLAQNPLELLDKDNRYIVGAGVDSRDYKERIPALVKAGADVLCIDSSDGYTDWQKEVIEFVREEFGDTVKIGAGNVVDANGFNFLADCGADFIKVGIGGGSICITREQKGIGRGQATALQDVAAARNAYYESNGVYIPICSDGGIVSDCHITLSLAMGADYVMQGRYYARFDESPGARMLDDKGNIVKEYWGEGSDRARAQGRYITDENDKSGRLKFAEGVDGTVPYAGNLKDNIGVTLAKVKSAMCNSGALSIPELHEKARLTVVSEASIKEGGAHSIILKESAYRGPRGG